MKYNAVVPLFLLAFASMAQASTVTNIKITSTSVSPNSAPAGTKFKFIATLDSPLVTGDKVKIELGKQLKSMTGTGTQYAFSQTIFTTGKQNYKVGIYNAKNVLQGVVNAGTYTVTSASPVNHAPTLTLSSADKSATANAAYTVTLNAKDVDANLSSITMSWGDSTPPDTLVATDGKDLIFTHTYVKEGKFVLSAIAKDNALPALSSKAITKTITVAAPVVVKSNYSKIANDGSILKDTSTLGTDAKDWACTKDNRTGLIWEVKTLDGGLHDASKGYNSQYGIAFAMQYGANQLVTDTNSANFCGSSDWRLPTLSELNSLAVYSLTSSSESSSCINGRCTSDISGYYSSSEPINTTYFPNFYGGSFFTSSSTEFYFVGSAVTHNGIPQDVLAAVLVRTAK